MTDTHYIIDILILLAAAVVAVPLFQRLGLGAVLGFLVAGAAVGPWGFGFIDAVEEIRHLDVPSHLHAWAAERNGLKAVRKEISLRSI